MKTSNKINNNNDVILDGTSKNKEVIFSIIKLSFVPIIIAIDFLIIFIIFTVSNSKFKSRFIEPLSNVVAYQEEDLYIVSTYYNADETSLKFLQTLNEVEDKYGIPYYLVDAAKYPKIIDVWDIKYWPTYFVFERKSTEDAKLLYKSYGNKEPVALYKEITNVQEYGMPTNELGISYSVKESNKEILSITPTKVSKNSSEENEFSITFSIKNSSSSQQNLNYSDFSVISNGWTTSEKHYFSLKNDNTITIEAGKTSEVTIVYIGDKNYPHNQIDITFVYSESEEETKPQNTWTYKMWPTNN